MTQKNEVTAIVAWAIMGVVFAIYSALMLDRSARTIAEFRTIALRNQALVLDNQKLGLSNQAVVVENQKLGLSNQELFKMHIKADEKNARELEEIRKLLRGRQP
jgi:hypothetical protein